MRIFGCIVYLRVHASEQSKLYPGAKECVFVGYSNTNKGYICYHPLTQNLYISFDVTFNELEMFYLTERAQQEEHEIHQGNDMDFLMYPRSITWSRETDKQHESSPILQ